MIPSTAGSESATKPWRKNKKSIMAGDIGLAMLEGRATTRFAAATCGAIRLKLLKTGAEVRISVRRIKFSMAPAFPYTGVFRTAWAAPGSAAF